MYLAAACSKGLRVGGKPGFASGSDPEDNEKSPRSASPPMAKGPSSPEPQGKGGGAGWGGDGEAAGEHVGKGGGWGLQGSAKAARSKDFKAFRDSASGHRRGLSWSGVTSGWATRNSGTCGSMSGEWRADGAAGA